MDRQYNNRGFGLVELLVGMTIGLVAILVVSQVLQGFEAQKRTSTGASDAQTNGNLALYLLDREIRMAGYGLVGMDGLLCPLGMNIYYNGTVPSNGSALAPVLVVDGGGAVPDIVTMVRSDTGFGALPTSVVKQMPNPSSIITASGQAGLQQGDLFVMAAKDGSKLCTLMQMSQPPQLTGNGYNLQHNPGGSSPWNPPNPNTVFTNAPTYAIGDVVINMGSFVHRRYEIQCDQLVEVNPALVAAPYTCNNTTPIVSQIVNMQAQYGVAPAGSQVVNQWVDATGTWAAPSAADVARIKAVRLAVVARSPQYEKDEVSPATLTLWDNGPTVSLGTDDRHYRYKIYETVIPLRNVIWANI